MPTPPEGPPTIKVEKTTIPTNFTGNLIRGTDNVDASGQPLVNSPLPEGSTIEVTEVAIPVAGSVDVLGTAAEINQRVQANLARIRAQQAARGDDQGSEQENAPITVEGKSKDSVFVVANNMKVEKNAGVQQQTPIGTERVLPFRVGTTLSGSFNGQDFDGTWTLQEGGKSGHFVYKKTK